MLDIVIIMNNYFHDVATAVLISAAVIMWVLGRQARTGGEGEMAVLAKAYPALRNFAVGALAWIVIGGVPRLVFFNTHDLGAVFDDLAMAIAIKHVVEIAAVVFGILMWRRVRAMIESHAGQASS